MSKDARRYDRLAAIGRAAGYSRLTGSTVHSWLKAGLLPPVVVQHPAFGVRIMVERPEVEAQLVAACRYRFEVGIRDIPLVGILVWLDGYEVAERLVKRGLKRLAQMPSRLVAKMRRRATTRQTDSHLIGEAASAIVFEQDLAARLGGSRDRSGALVDGLTRYLGMLLGEPDADLDDAGLERLGELMGLPRARRDRIGLVGPRVMDSSADALRKVGAGLREERLIKCVTDATAEDLSCAREHGLLIARVMRAIVRTAADLGDPGFSGLDALGRFLEGRYADGLVTLSALAFPEGTAALVKAFQEIAHSG